ncbi:winged helix-turn-helix transcriptional regulator [Rhodococcus erythropolis]|uniref:MarR family winged helix-turn-helix transcriptional regulator n=1 Tax=Rhodococcus erythropolis TaxID=1833 RepID=UPI001C9ABC52|nr:MarR family winged helix-turn-helix transcriptional regulator [Rhodococcus erythropolis]MBY6382337.1 winged helix-turn-helix transcriptional regulator [Rhodococcus erythropolis]
MSSPEYAPSLSRRPGFVFIRAALRIRQIYAEALAGVGLLPNQHAILSTLEELGPCHQKELAKRVVVDPADIVAYLDGLQTNGHVVRERDPNDRRRQIVTITDTGREILAESDRALDEVEADTFSVLSAKDRDNLDRIATRLYEAQLSLPNSGISDESSLSSRQTPRVPPSRR